MRKGQWVTLEIGPNDPLALLNGLKGWIEEIPSDDLITVRVPGIFRDYLDDIMLKALPHDVEEARLVAKRRWDNRLKDHDEVAFNFWWWQVKPWLPFDGIDSPVVG